MIVQKYKNQVKNITWTVAHTHIQKPSLKYHIVESTHMRTKNPWNFTREHHILWHLRGCKRYENISVDDRPSTHVVRCIARPDLIRRGGGGVRCFSEVVASKVAENGRNFTVIWFSLVLLVLTKRVFAADFGRVTEFMWMVVARCALVVRCVEPRTGRCGNICASAVFFGDCISAGDSDTLIYVM